MKLLAKSEIDIIMLGSPKILFNKKQITNRLSSKSIGLLCYLSANENESREKLAYMFWEDSNADAAKYNLRYNIWTMNKLLRSSLSENQLLVSNNSRIHINKEYDIYLDIKEIDTLYSNKESHLSIHILKKLKSLFLGEFLDGFYLKNCLKFNDWVFYEREKYQKKYIDILNKLLSIYKKNKEYNKGLQILEEMIMLNSLDEDLYVELIKIYLELGDRVSALKQYNRCIHILREELNIAPKESTEKLLKIIKNTKCKKAQFPYCKHDKSNLINIQYEELQNIKKGIKKLEGKNVFTKCIPLENLNYNYITSLTDQIISISNKKELEKVDKNIWINLQRVSIKAERYAEDSIQLLTVETERNIIYNSLFSFLKKISTEKRLNIIIEKLHFMDKYSFDFIKYVLFKRDEINCIIFYTCDINDSKYIELKQYL